MGNNTSAAELTRQGALLGEKLIPTSLPTSSKNDHNGSELPPKVCFQGLSLSKMQRIQKQIEFEYPFLVRDRPLSRFSSFFVHTCE
jgi:hypothetical protein